MGKLYFLVFQLIPARIPAIEHFIWILNSKKFKLWYIFFWILLTIWNTCSNMRYIFLACCVLTNVIVLSDYIFTVSEIMFYFRLWNRYLMWLQWLKIPPIVRFVLFFNFRKRIIIVWMEITFRVKDPYRKGLRRFVLVNNAVDTERRQSDCQLCWVNKLDSHILKSLICWL